MLMELNPTEIRVLGCLLEKEMATPDYYPLTLNALVNACNQKSNRHPVMALDEATILRTLDEMRTTHHLALETHVANSRVPKYKHTIEDHWDLTLAEISILCELFLRGAQTPGELRTHASRLRPLTDCREVEELLNGLSTHPDGPFVVQLPREPGRREQRWAHLLGGETEMEETAPEPIPEADAPPRGPSPQQRLQSLEEEVVELRQSLESLQAEFAAFKQAFE